MKFCIDWEPIGIRSEAESGQDLLSAAQKAGVQLAAICGGHGNCGACRVVIRNGVCNPLTNVEISCLTPTEIQSGMRLACMTTVQSDMKISIPPESLSSSQRLQLEGLQIAFSDEETPVITIVDLEMAVPDIDDLRSDTRRVRDALDEKGFNSVSISDGLLRSISITLRENHWHLLAVLRECELIALLPTGSKLYGLAVDIGTTKIAAYLIDLTQNKCSAKCGAMNPQISYGEDVVSRIAYTDANEDGRDTLQSVLIETLNGLIDQLCQAVSCNISQIVDAVVVCNTAIHHFFVNLPVNQLGLYPFIPAVSASLHLSAVRLGLHLSDGAGVYLPRNVAGYVGADHVSMLVGSAAWCSGKNRIALDIGTNTEISLITQDGAMYCCSCASGPAFEGAHIHNGMRAASGAIERAQIVDRELQYKTIDDQPAVGICGSGILDLVAELKKSGAINDNGQFNQEFPHVRKAVRNYEYVIVSETEDSAQAVTITRSDINEILLAKSAIRTGLEILLIQAGLKDQDIEEFVVAGAFGTYLDVANAVEIGMFPDIPLERFVQVGNAAGAGAQEMLLSADKRVFSEKMVDKMKYVELTNHPAFKDVLVSSMNLRKGEIIVRNLS